MTSYDYYTDKVVGGKIAHDDDETYDEVEHFPYHILFNIDITSSDAYSGKVYLIITDQPNKAFLWFYSSNNVEFIEMRRAFAYGLSSEEMYGR